MSFEIQASTVFLLTNAGRIELAQKTSAISVGSRMVLTQVDGNRSFSKLAPGMDQSRLREAIDFLIGSGYITADGLNLAKTSPSISKNEVVSSKPKQVQSQPTKKSVALNDDAIYARAYPIAVEIVSKLGFRGVFLNMAVESAAGRKGLLDLLPKFKKSASDEDYRKLENALGTRA